MTALEPGAVRRPGIVVGVLMSTHPGPAVAVTLVTVTLAIGIGLDPWRVAVLALAMALDQASVGLSNDWLDAERDRSVGRSDKPVARGWVSVGVARTVAIGCAVASIIVTIPLGGWATLAHAVFLASAWAYNAGLKSTPFSLAPYVLSFGLLPVVVTLALPEPRLATGWAVVLGALLGSAAHFANVLPDLADDDRTGVRGLPHRLGATASGLITFGVLAIAGVVGAVGVLGVVGGASSGDGLVSDGIGGPVAVAGAVSSVVLAVAGVVLVLTRPPSRLLFRLIIAAALVDVVVLATSGSRLVG